MREKVSFSVNVPTAVMLEGLGSEQSNRAGEPEYRYFLQGDRVMWVPPEVHGAIQELQHRHGTGGLEVAITKQQTKRGAPVRWTVEHIMEEPAADPAPPIRQQRTPDARSAEQWERQPGQGWTRRDPTDPPPTNGNGHHAPQPAPRPAPPPAPRGNAYDAAEQPLTMADKLAGALCAAVDAAADATVYASRKGLHLTWDAGDIRAMANTLFIHATGGGK